MSGTSLFPVKCQRSAERRNGPLKPLPGPFHAKSGTRDHTVEPLSKGAIRAGKQLVGGGTNLQIGAVDQNRSYGHPGSAIA